MQVEAVGIERRLLHRRQQDAGAFARRALVMRFGVAERIHDPDGAELLLRLQKRRMDDDRGIHAARDRRRLRLRGRVDDGDVERLRIGIAELVAQHLRQHVVGIAAEQRADRLALEIREIADRRVLARCEHETEMAFADGDDLDRLILRDEAFDRRIAPHAEVEIARDERLHLRRGGWIVAVIDGEVVARVAGEALERLVVHHVLRDRRIAGGPGLAADRHLGRLAGLPAHHGRRRERDRCGARRRDEAPPRRTVAMIATGHVFLLLGVVK